MHIKYFSQNLGVVLDITLLNTIYIEVLKKYRDNK